VYIQRARGHHAVSTLPVTCEPFAMGGNPIDPQEKGLEKADSADLDSRDHGETLRSLVTWPPGAAKNNKREARMSKLNP